MRHGGDGWRRRRPAAGACSTGVLTMCDPGPIATAPCLEQPMMFANTLSHEPSRAHVLASREAHALMPIRVLSVGDDPLVHEGIRALLAAEDDMALVGEVGSDD